MQFTTTDAEIAHITKQASNAFEFEPGVKPAWVRFVNDFLAMREEWKALATLANMIALDGNMPQFPEPAKKLRAFIDEYIEQGKELESAREGFQKILAIREKYQMLEAFIPDDDLVAAIVIAEKWLDASSEKGAVA